MSDCKNIRDALSRKHVSVQDDLFRLAISKPGIDFDEMPDAVVSKFFGLSEMVQLDREIEWCFGYLTGKGSFDE